MGRPLREFPTVIQREIVRRYKSGETLRQLAGSYHTHEPSIKRVLQEQEVELRAPGRGAKREFSVNDEMDVIRDYQMGTGMLRLGQKYGCHPYRIRDILDKYRIPIMHQGNNRLPAFSDEEYNKLYYLHYTKPKRAAKRKGVKA